MFELPLPGLDGGNPLGLLAALGVLEAVSSSNKQERLYWRHHATWQPVLCSDLANLDDLIQKLDVDRRGCVNDEAFSLEYDGKRDLKPKPDDYATFLRGLTDNLTPASRRSADWASAFASDVIKDSSKGNTKPTALHFTAGQQQFLQMVRELVERVSKDDLREALEGPWTYKSPLPVMGWDATSSRDYALRASDPSTDKKLGVAGADWMAIRGLPFLQTAPHLNKLLTTGCSGGWKDGAFTWPLWTVPLNGPVVGTLLRQDFLRISLAEREARGIGIVLRSAIRRSEQGGYGSFGPATVA